MTDIWLHKFRQRHTWAKRAYDRFVAEMDPELIGDFTRPERITVVVYGMSQVGKTTLILDLLGICQEALPSVSHVLRGMQPMGKSSTASPIRYGRSPDNLWYIGKKTLGLSNEEATEYFGDIRKQVMSGSSTSSSILNIYIPGKFFQDNDKQVLNLDLRLIDIPGIHARNKHEQNEARRIAERYVTSADLILLIGRADDLGFLHPKKLNFEPLNDWMLQPSRFRIVLTYSFSAESFQTWFNSESFTAQEVQQYIYNQICTHDERPPLEMCKHIYPLELGDSLESMRGKKSELYFDRANSVIDVLRSELLDSISSAASPYARLWSAFRIGEFIEAKVKRNNDAFDRQRTTLEHAISQAQHSVSEAEALLNDAKNEDIDIEYMHRRNEQRLRHFNRGAYAQRLDRYFSIKIKPESGETVTALQEALNEFRILIHRNWSNLWYSLARLTTGELSPPSTTELRLIKDKLDGYWTDSYLRSSNYRTDTLILQHQAEIVCSNYAQTSNKELGTKIQTAWKLSIQHKRNSKVILKTMISSLASCQRNLQDAEQLLLDVEQQHFCFNERMAQSLEHALKFKQYIFEGFRSELNTMLSVIAKPKNSIEQLCDIFYTLLLPLELDKMLNGDE